MPLEETVTIRRPVEATIAAMVDFARSLADKDIRALTDEDLIEAARAFWNRRHGDD
jgi:hypothetical protein